jgi:hypothetical protein
MPPRYAYWTIIAGGLPTAFRAADRDDLLPTFQRIKEKHPDAQMKYFARGKLWESQDAARAAQHRGGDHRPRPSGGNRSGPPAAGNRGGRPPGSDRRGQPSGSDRRGRPSLSAEARGAKAEGHPEQRRRPEKRSRDWRPGGEHRDPRQKFVDAKKQRNAAIRKERWQRKNADGIRDHTRPQGIKPKGTRRPWERKPWVRAQGTEEPEEPPKPRGPNREPSPNEEPEPAPPPRPDEPAVPAPGPPERGGHARRPFQPRGRFPKGPRR